MVLDYRILTSTAKFVAGLVMLQLAVSASAHERDYVWTIQWYSPYAGERELELYYTDFGGGRGDIQLEIEFGIDGKYMIAPYVLIDRKGDDYRINGWKIEQKYSFGDFKWNTIMPALYFEIKSKDNESTELEAKLVGTYISKNRVTWSANLKLDRHMEDGAPVKWGYAAAVSMPYGDGYTIGLEEFGSLTKGEYFVGPTVGKQFERGTKLLAGYAFSTKGDPGRFRLIFQREF